MKLPSISRLKRKLDKVFPRMILKRDEGKRCISCGRRPGSQPGHYCRRNSLASRWHPHNVNGQCGPCNIFSDGDVMHNYAEALERKYGPGTASHLRQLYIRSWKPDRVSLTALISAAEVSPEAYERAWELFGSEAILGGLSDGKE